MSAGNEQGTGPGAGYADESPLTVRVDRTQERVAVCHVAGDLDIESLAPAQESLSALVEQGTPVVVVDLSGVGFCDSSGLNLLLKTRAAALAAGVDFRLAAVAPTVRRVLDLTGAQAVFTVFDSVDAALAA
ncbi:STAS domain-containing protein [Streptomyces sp. NPDC097619]|uniref:STAS domain-containing protein n=1 Tax=Streptomyces sp. NPDC097619 TaxID=3157228 RepID=UPI00332C6B45